MIPSYGGYAELGFGDATNRGDVSNEMGDALPFVQLSAVPRTLPTSHLSILPAGPPTAKRSTSPTMLLTAVDAAGFEFRWQPGGIRGIPT